MAINYNYHTHTYRCGHASGEDEEYIIEAFTHGITELGFADHVMLPNYDQPGIRGSFKEHFNDYINSLRYLKEVYKDKVNLKIGFEAEYMPEYEAYYRELLDNGIIDYLIMGQHCYMADNRLVWYLQYDMTIDNVKHYVDDVIKGMNTGLFKYVCHPDMFVIAYKEWNKDLEKESLRLIKEAKRLNIPLEINCGGIRFRKTRQRPLQYPCDEFFKLVAKVGVPVVIGIDAHKPEEINDEDIAEALEMVKRLNLNLITDYKI